MSDVFDHLHEHLNKTVAFSREETSQVLAKLEKTILKKGEFLFSAGEICTRLGFIHRGCLEYYFIDNKGEKHIAYFAVEDWWVGDTGSFFEKKPSIYYLEALEETEIYTANYAIFNYLLDNIKPYSTYFRIRSNVSATSITKRFIDFKSMEAEDRYLEFVKKYPDLIQRIPQHRIAAFLGIKPQSLSRIRKKMAGR